MIANISGKRILIVDDDQDFVHQTKALLEKEGFSVIYYHTRVEAEANIANENFDLAIVDLLLENVDDGFAINRQIKKKNPAIPIIMVSAVGHETGIEFSCDTEEERTWVKADILLDKPFRFEQLWRETEKLLGI